MIKLKVKILRSFKEKTIGLLNAKKAIPVFIKTRFGIHTFGLKFSIDVLVLDKNDKVVKISKNLRPDRIFLWNPVFNKIVELPSGEINKNKIKIGDKIRIISYNTVHEK
ncbi:MAG: DUF192 domain-containing protein [Patescibacteria group bacterium]|nr:DUF192 domain-containing protein [Patescibacteria group bacterium]